MTDTEIKIDPLSLKFDLNGEKWEAIIPKSRTQMTNKEQFKLITEKQDYFVPLTVNEKDDAYHLTFIVDKDLHTWEDLKKLTRNHQLRALSNVAKLFKLLSTRVTFFLHPNNIAFNENLTPMLIYRGIRNVLQPYEMTEEDVLKQYQCLSIALFSNKYTFDDLYNGSLQHATDTKFERQVKEKSSLRELRIFLSNCFQEEEQFMKQKMVLVPKKRFRLFKQMAIWMTVLSVITVALLLYSASVKIPYQDRLLEAQNKFLANDYTEVIHTLQNENIDKLPFHAKYILAYAYLKVEQLSDAEKESIMKNISLKSDQHYLEYWIYNGLGDFEQSIDIAKYMDDPQLIMYGLIKKTEQVKNDPDLSGTERDEEVRELRTELEKYAEEYELIEETFEEEAAGDAEEEHIEQESSTKDENEDDEEEAKSDKSKE